MGKLHSGSHSSLSAHEFLSLSLSASHNFLLLFSVPSALPTLDHHHPHLILLVLLSKPKLPPLPSLNLSSSSPFLYRQSSPPSPSVSWSDSRGHLLDPSVADHRPPLALLGLHSEAAPHLLWFWSSRAAPVPLRSPVGSVSS